MSDIFTAADPTLAPMFAARDAMAKGKATPPVGGDVDAAAKEFEAMFLSEMLRPMFDGIDADPLFGGGQSEETWRGLMIEEYGKQIASSGGIGLSDAIKAKMIEMQEVVNQ